MSDRHDRTTRGRQLLAQRRATNGVDAGRLTDVLGRAAMLASCQRKVARLLADPLSQHVHVVGLHQGDLRLLVRTSAQATRLRYQQRDLLTAIGGRIEHQGKYHAVTKLSIVVRPPPPGDGAQPEPTPIGISAAAAEHLEGLAGAEEDAQLKASLLRLAGRRR